METNDTNQNPQSIAPQEPAQAQTPAQEPQGEVSTNNQSAPAGGNDSAPVFAVDKSGNIVIVNPNSQTEEPATKPDAQAAANDQAPQQSATTQKAPDIDWGKTVKIKVDGQEQEVPLEELRNGYMRNADLT